MAYDREIADRIRAALADADGVTEKPMFGTLVFMVDGQIAVAAGQDGLMVRLGEDAVPEALTQPHVRRPTMGKRTMKGWVLVAPEAELDGWIERGVARARSG
jgi:TfoX N-terminal domain